MADDNTTTKSKEKRGGKRHILTWQEKLALADPAAVRDFISGPTCQCRCGCMKQLRQLGEAGVQVVVNLRDERVAGKHLDDAVITSFVNCHKVSPGWRIFFS
jgi:hypothetical protein